MTEMKSGFLVRFAAMAKSARFQFWMGMTIALAGLLEVIEEVEHFIEASEVGAMHGVVLVGLLHAAKGLGEMIEGGTHLRETHADSAETLIAPEAGKLTK